MTANGTDTEPPPSLRRLESPAATGLAVLCATFEDLQTVLRCCELLVGLLAPPEGEEATRDATDPVVVEAVWTVGPALLRPLLRGAGADGGRGGTPHRGRRGRDPPRCGGARVAPGHPAAAGPLRRPGGEPPGAVLGRRRAGRRRRGEGGGGHLDPAAPGRRAHGAPAGRDRLRAQRGGRRRIAAGQAQLFAEVQDVSPADLAKLTGPRRSRRPTPPGRSRRPGRTSSKEPVSAPRKPRRPPRSRSSAVRCPCSGPPSWPRSPTSTPATSPPTSPPARRYGYLLLWVLIVSNLMAMLIQYLSAKAGIATGKSLAELCRDVYPRGRSPTACGPRPRSSPSRPTWPRCSAGRWRCGCSSASRCSSAA